MFSNVPQALLEELASKPNLSKGKPAEFPTGDLDGENCGSYLKLKHGDDGDERMTIITVLPNLETKDPGHIIAAVSGRTFLMFTGSELSVEVKNTEDPLKPYTLTFTTGEALLHSIKAALFEDYEGLKKIYYAEDPKLAKSFGRKVKGFKPEVWTAIAPQAAAIINAFKCKQDLEVKGFISRLAYHAAKHAIPFPENFRVLEAKDDTLYGTGLSHKDTMELITDYVDAGDIKILREKFSRMESDPTMSWARQYYPKMYPLTGFFPGQDWMGCAITKAIKWYMQDSPAIADAMQDSDEPPGAVTRTGSCKRLKTDEA